MTTENGTLVITKQDELNALAKIRKIIKGLGENSYVGTAFDGVFELAERNIEFDAAFSTNFYIEEYHNAGKHERELNNKHEREMEERNRELESMSEKLRNAYEVANERQKQINDLQEKLEGMAKLSAQNFTVSVEGEQKLAQAQGEIIKLKAQLYDLLVAGKEESAK